METGRPCGLILHRLYAPVPAALSMDQCETPPTFAGLSTGAVHADAVLIPEIDYDLSVVSAALRERLESAGHALVVVAQGASPARGPAIEEPPAPPTALQAALSPMSTGPNSGRGIRTAGHAAESAARELQRLTDHRPTRWCSVSYRGLGRHRPRIANSAWLTAPTRLEPWSTVWTPPWWCSSRRPCRSCRWPRPSTACTG